MNFDKFLSELQSASGSSRGLIDWLIRAFNRGWKEFDEIGQVKLAFRIERHLPQPANFALSEEPPNRMPRDPDFATWLLTVGANALAARESDRDVYRDRFLEYAGFFFGR